MKVKEYINLLGTGIHGIRMNYGLKKMKKDRTSDIKCFSHLNSQIKKIYFNRFLSDVNVFSLLFQSVMFS